MRTFASICCLVFLISTATSQAQTDLNEQLAQLTISAELPEGIQSNRSIVFLKTDLSTELATPKGRDMLAKKFHQPLAEMHIDPVAYFRWQDLVAGYDASNSYMEAIASREVSQIIVLQVVDSNHEIFIVPAGHDKGLFDTSQSTWHASSPSLEGVVDILALAVRRADLEISNFLIAGTPEVFIDTDIFKKNRFESFQPDLKLDKLAAPLFSGLDPENIEDQEDLELKALLETQYPFSFDLVSKEMSEDLMKKAGFQYVLRYLHGEESTLLTLLDYQDQSEDPLKLSYKFYIKHLISGDIYLGESWDSRSSWQSALSIHLSNMRRELKVE